LFPDGFGFSCKPYCGPSSQRRPGARSMIERDGRHFGDVLRVRCGTSPLMAHMRRSSSLCSHHAFPRECAPSHVVRSRLTFPRLIPPPACLLELVRAVSRGTVATYLLPPSFFASLASFPFSARRVRDLGSSRLYSGSVSLPFLSFLGVATSWWTRIWFCSTFSLVGGFDSHISLISSILRLSRERHDH